MRRLIVCAVGLATLMSLLTNVQTLSAKTPDVNTPVFSARNFNRESTTIDNPYFPLKPGTTFVYEGHEDVSSEHDEVLVTHDSKTILGVNCVVVKDTVWLDGELEELTYDWYAQDKDGNVWYMGEYATAYAEGVRPSHEGSWEAGVDGAKPGYIMEAHPRVGDAYQQEYLADVAEDAAQVIDLRESERVPYGSWRGNVLVTKERSPLEPGVIDEKSYAPGIGNIKSETVKGGSAESHLVDIRTERGGRRN